MSTTTPRAQAPLLAAAQAQKHVTHNEALLQLDALLSARILDRDLSAPPANPTDGDAYLVAANPTGAWAGQDGKIAFAADGGWRFYAPFAGLAAFIADESAMLVYTATGWKDWASVLNLQNVPLLGVNTAADSTNKFALKSNAALFAAREAANGGTGDMRIVNNKEAAGKTASFLFQDNFSGRAEIGLTGDDNFHFKVSPDGAVWTEALTVAAAAGRIGLGTATPAANLDMPANSASQNNARFGSFGIQSTGNANGFVQNNSYWNGSQLIYQNAGAVALFQFIVGDIQFRAAPSGAAGTAATLTTNMVVKNGGNVGIGVTSPAVKLDVAGPVKVQSYTVASVPAASAGAGQIVFVSDESGGAVIAFSDGTNWRRVTDRAVVS